MQATIEQLQDTIARAAEARTPLQIHGTGSKHFYGNPARGERLDVSGYSGIIDYDPRELVISVRAGTTLRAVEATMAAEGQMLACEPPCFGGTGTIGGCVAAGLSGPRRAYAGAVRDLLLGARIVNGKGEDLSFGGRVIKNVAGYDVTRLMAGAMGTLGVLLEVSFKALPLPAAQQTLRFEMDETQAIETMNRWAGQPLPLSATCYHAGILTVRLSGAQAAVRAAQAKLGGEQVAQAEDFWLALRDQSAPFFADAHTLWRVSLPSTTMPLNTGLPQLIEWGGGLRWLAGVTDAAQLRQQTARLGGHAILFRSADKSAGAFHPLPPGLAKIHRGLKHAFDPHGILNPGRLYDDL